MKQRHVIWDWNGTLLNDVQISHEITNRGLKRFGVPEVSLEHSRSVFALPITTYYERIGVDFEKIPLKELQHHFHDEYERRRTEAKLHDGIEQLLQTLKGQGRTQSILSAHPASTLRLAVRDSGIEHFFSEIVGAENNFGESKVQAGRRWMQETKRHDHSIVMIGDTVHDFEVASELEIACILIAHGYQSRDALVQTGVPVVDSVNELKAALLDQ